MRCHLTENDPNLQPDFTSCENFGITGTKMIELRKENKKKGEDKKPGALWDACTSFTETFEFCKTHCCEETRFRCRKLMNEIFI